MFNCIVDRDDAVKAIAEELTKALADRNIVFPDPSVIREHARLEKTDSGLEYYWDDEIIMETDNLVTFDGIRITRYERDDENTE